jgi:sulfite oxidase
VYDITEFVARHPGGEKILLASGGPLEPFWSLYGVHKSSKQAAELLEGLRIGNVSAADRCATLARCG